MSSNPWKSTGVSVVPENLKDWMPLVGQKKLFDNLHYFKNQSLAKSRDELAGFFALVGGWGLGKSKIGHEICLEAVDPDIEWIIDGNGYRILEPGLQEGLLPLFVRYSQVTDGPIPVATESWVAATVYSALKRLVQKSEEAGSALKRNQARLYGHAHNALLPKGFEGINHELSVLLQRAAENSSTEKASSPVMINKNIREALNLLKTVGIKQLWIVVDEIEDITDVKREGLDDQDRKGIDQRYLTVIPGVIKQEEIRQDYPDVNFLLLCSRAVGDIIRDIKALQRRTGFWELQSNSFADVEQYFQYLKDYRPDIFRVVRNYPNGLKEAAFFAANRNFGWFNVIMYYCHNNFRDGSVPVPDLLKMFAKDDSRASRSVFDIEAVSDFNIPAGPNKPQMLNLIYGQLPAKVGDSWLSRELAQSLLLEKHYGTNQALFASLVEVLCPPEHEIMQHMVRSGLRNESGNILILPGEARFDLGEVLASLRSYSIGLPEKDRDHLLVFTSIEEFIEQIRGLTPYEQQAQFIAGPLHRLLVEEGYRVREGMEDREYIAPSFSFMLRFNLLNKRTKAETGYLKDDNKNRTLEEEYNKVCQDGKKRIAYLLRGMAQVWEDAVVEGTSDSELTAQNFAFTTNREPLDLGAKGEVTMLYISDVEEADLQRDLTRVARKAAHPVIVVVEGMAEKEKELIAWIAHNAKELSPFVTIKNVTGFQSEILIRFGLMGTKAYGPSDLRTSYFNGGISILRQHLYQLLESQDNSWRMRLEIEGLIIRPVFFRKNSGDELKLLAKGYSHAIGGRSYTALLQEADTSLNPDQKEDFKRAVKNHVQLPAKYEGFRRMILFGDESAYYAVQVPRCLITLLHRFGDLGRTVADLETRFMYDKPVDFKPAEVLRQAIEFLVALGLLVPEGNGRYRRVTVKGLKDEVQTASAWLENDFKLKTAVVKNVSEQLAANLREVLAIDGKSKLKAMRTDLNSLNLEFLTWDSEKLQTADSDGRPGYETSFARAVNGISRAKETISRVYDAEDARNFSYSSDLLPSFEVESGQPGYPLWKKVFVLHGFCSGLIERRTELTAVIDRYISENDDRVPAEDTGQKAFPTQVLSIPLKQLKQELHFYASNMEANITGAASTAQTNTLGFRVALGKYHEACKRLEEIKLELTGPNKLPVRYFACLDKWEKLISQVKAAEEDLYKWERFFADAMEDVKRQFGIPVLMDDLSRMREEIVNGGIRQGTDDRESAGTPAFNLIDGLEQDLKEVEERPMKLTQVMGSLKDSILQTLQKKYQDDYKALLSAYNRLLLAQKKDPRAFPDKLAKTYRETVTTFDKIVADAETMGTGFFSGQSEISWADFVALCDVVVSGADVDWNANPYAEYVHFLQKKGLLRLQLIS